MIRILILAAAAATLMACQPAPETAPEPATEAAEAQQKTQIAEAASTEETATACAADLGQEAAQALVDRCIQVSPATHPPCNVANPCAMIRGEIERSCALFPEGEKPAACTA